MTKSRQHWIQIGIVSVNRCQVNIFHSKLNDSLFPYRFDFEEQLTFDLILIRAKRKERRTLTNELKSSGRINVQINHIDLFNKKKPKAKHIEQKKKQNVKSNHRESNIRAKCVCKCEVCGWEREREQKQNYRLRSVSLDQLLRTKIDVQEREREKNR